jgi:hypothetical protein
VSSLRCGPRRNKAMLIDHEPSHRLLDRHGQLVRLDHDDHQGLYRPRRWRSVHVYETFEM